MYLIVEFPVARISTVSGKIKYAIADSASDSEIEKQMTQNDYVSKVQTTADDKADFTQHGRIRTEAIETVELEIKAAKVKIHDDLGE